MNAEQKAQGRGRVQTLFWNRIDEAGMKRPRGQTLEEQAALRKRLLDRLAYMTPDNLRLLAELMIENAAGQACRPRNVIWSEAAIRSEAKALQTPPPMVFEIVRSWLASIEGPPAIAAGIDVELYRYLARTGRPPKDYDMRLIREAADGARQQIALITERRERDVATSDQIAWLEAYLRDRARVAEIVAGGTTKRQTSQQVTA